MRAGSRVARRESAGVTRTARHSVQILGSTALDAPQGRIIAAQPGPIRARPAQRRASFSGAASDAGLGKALTITRSEERNGSGPLGARPLPVLRKILNRQPNQLSRRIFSRKHRARLDDFTHRAIQALNGVRRVDERADFPRKCEERSDLGPSVSPNPYRGRIAAPQFGIFKSLQRLFGFIHGSRA